MTIPLAGLECGSTLIFLTAIDRLFCILWPVKHRNLHKSLYLLILGSFCLTYYAFFIYSCYVNALATPDKYVFFISIL